MAAFSWHITYLMTSLSLLVTSCGAVPIAYGEPSPTDTDIVYLDEHHLADPGQFRSPALPSFLPLEGDIEGRPLPQYPPTFETTIEGQKFIDTQSRSAGRHRDEILSTSATHSPSIGVTDDGPQDASKASLSFETHEERVDPSVLSREQRSEPTSATPSQQLMSFPGLIMSRSGEFSGPMASLIAKRLAQLSTTEAENGDLSSSDEQSLTASSIQKIMSLMADSQSNSPSSFGEQDGIIGKSIPPAYLLKILGLMASDFTDPKPQPLADDPNFFGEARTSTLIHSVLSPPEDFPFDRNSTETVEILSNSTPFEILRESLRDAFLYDPVNEVFIGEEPNEELTKEELLHTDDFDSFTENYDTTADNTDLEDSKRKSTSISDEHANVVVTFLPNNVTDELAEPNDVFVATESHLASSNSSSDHVALAEEFETATASAFLSIDTLSDEKLSLQSTSIPSRVVGETYTFTTSLPEVSSSVLSQNLSTRFRGDVPFDEETQSTSSTVSEELFNATHSEPSSLDVSLELLTYQPELLETTTPFSFEIQDQVTTLHSETNFSSTARIVRDSTTSALTEPKSTPQVVLGRPTIENEITTVSPYLQETESETQSEGMTSSTESPVPEVTSGSKLTSVSTGFAVEKTATTNTPSFVSLLENTVDAEEDTTKITIKSKDVSGDTNDEQTSLSPKVTTSKSIADSSAVETSTTNPSIIVEDTKNLNFTDDSNNFIAGVFVEMSGRSMSNSIFNVVPSLQNVLTASTTDRTQPASAGVVAPDSGNVSVSHGNPPKSILAGLDYDLSEVFGDFGDYESSPVIFSTPLRPSPVNVESTTARGSAVRSSLPIVFPSNTTSNDFATIEAIAQLAQQPISAPQKPETPLRVLNLPDNEPIYIPQTVSEDSHSEIHSEVHITKPETQKLSQSSQLLEPENSLPKVINRPGNNVDYSYTKLQEEVQPTPHFPLSNGPSSYPEYVPVAPITNAILNPTDDAPTKFVASLNGEYDDPTQGTYQPAPGAIFFPQDPQLTYSSYSEVPATSLAVLKPSEVPEEFQGEVPYNGFLATLWNTGSPRQAATGLASNLWKGITDGVTKKVAKKWEGFNKIVGKKVGKKGKKLLIKTAPIVKKIVGLKAAASLFQGAGITKTEIGGEGGLVVPVVIEYQAPSATYGAPLAETKQVEHQPSLSNYQPDAPAQSYGAPAPLAATPFVAFPTASTPPVFKKVPEITAPVHHEVVVHEPTIVTVTETKHTYPAAPKPEYDPTLQYRPLPSQQQTIPVPAPVVYLPAPPAQQVGYFSYIAPQASHLIRNQGTDGETSENHGITKPRTGIFGIVNKVEESYNNAYNVFQYGRNLTHQASESLSSLWPGNWFRSNGEIAQASSVPLQSQYGAPQSTYGATPQAPQPTYGAPPQAPQPTYGAPPQAPQPTYRAPPQALQPTYGAPPQALQPTYRAPPQAPQPTYGAPPQTPQLTYGAPASSIPAPFPIPIASYPQVNADGTHVYQYPVKSDVPASSGYVAHYEHETAHASYAPSYVAPFPVPVVQGKEEDSSASGLSFVSDLGKKKIGRLDNSFLSK